MMPHLCWLLGHSRGSVSDRVETQAPDAFGFCKVVRFCGCCGKPADGFSVVRRTYPGEIIPRGFGVAWVRWDAPTAVLLPIPLNLVAGALYRLRNWAKVPRGLIDDPAEAYRQGYREGAAAERAAQTGGAA